MVATATEKFATEPQMNYLRSLARERVWFGFDPDSDEILSFAEARALLDVGTKAARKPRVVVKVEPGYYVRGEDVFVVVRSKSNPDRTYAKQMVVNPDTKRGRWDFVPGAVGALAGLQPLTLEEAARLGRKHGSCMICGRPLTDDVRKGSDGLTSIERGIGPVCKGKVPASMANPPRAGLTTDAPGGTTGQAVVARNNTPQHDCEAYDGECVGWAGYHGNSDDAPEWTI